MVWTRRVGESFAIFAILYCRQRKARNGAIAPRDVVRDAESCGRPNGYIDVANNDFRLSLIFLVWNYLTGGKLKKCLEREGL